MPVANIINAVGNIYDSKFLTKYLNRLAENTHYVENLGKQYEFILNKQKYSKNKLGWRKKDKREALENTFRDFMKNSPFIWNLNDNR